MHFALFVNYVIVKFKKHAVVIHEQENFICSITIALYHVITDFFSFKSGIGLKRLTDNIKVPTRTKMFAPRQEKYKNILLVDIRICKKRRKIKFETKLLFLLLHTFLSTMDFLITIINLTYHLLSFSFSTYVMTAMRNRVVKKVYRINR